MVGGHYNADTLESRIVNPCTYAAVLDAGNSLAEDVQRTGL